MKNESHSIVSICTCFSSAIQVSEFFFHIQKKKKKETLFQLTCDLIINCIFSCHCKFFINIAVIPVLSLKEKRERYKSTVHQCSLPHIQLERGYTECYRNQGNKRDLPPRDPRDETWQICWCQAVAKFNYFTSFKNKVISVI